MKVKGTRSATRFARGAVTRVRPQELDVLTPDSRSRERYKRVGLTAATSVWATGISLGTGLVSVPLALHHLGSEQYGLWVTVTSVAALLGFANLGLSNGLVNGVSEALGGNDRLTAARYVSSAFTMLLVITALLGFVFAALYRSVPWAEIFNVTSPDAVRVAGPALAVMFTLTLVGLPLSVVPGIQAGLQEGFSSNVWRSVGSVLSLGGLFVAIGADADLPWLVLALAGGPVAATLLNATTLFHRRAWLRPRLSLVTRSATRRMMRFGLLFFILSISGAVAYETDNIVIAQLLGPEEVTQYAIPMRLFLTAPLVLSFALIPLWPAYGDALARGDKAWIRRAFTRSLGASIALGVLMSAGLLIFATPILHAWVGTAIDPTTPLLVGLATWSFFNCISGPLSMLLNGSNVIGFQVICAVAMMTANLALSIALTSAIGISGPVWGSVIAQFVFVLVPSSIYVRSLLRRLPSSESTAGS